MERFHIVLVLYIIIFFLTDGTHYWVFSCPILIHINLEAPPITYSVCSDSRISWQTLQPITLWGFFVLRERLYFSWTMANGFECRTRGELHHTQTPALTTWLSGPSFIDFDRTSCSKTSRSIGERLERSSWFCCTRKSWHHFTVGMMPN